MSSKTLFALWLVVCPLCSQFETTLAPATLSAFDTYVKAVEQTSLNRAIEEGKLLKGSLIVRPAASPNPREVPDGLVHDWIGAVFIPNTSIEKVLNVLEDFDQHAKIYPEIIRSRLEKRQGDDVKGYWRLERKQQFVPAVFDVEEEAHYKEIAPGKWIGRAHATEIREVQDAGSSHERDFAPGEGLGLLWRLNAYWSFEARDNGVLAECRTISLSRGIPSGMGWMIRPFIQNVPRESLTSTLQNTRRILQ